jgi:hypothetical protein
MKWRRAEAGVYHSDLWTVYCRTRNDWELHRDGQFQDRYTSKGDAQKAAAEHMQDGGGGESAPAPATEAPVSPAAVAEGLTADELRRAIRVVERIAGDLAHLSGAVAAVANQLSIWRTERKR